MFPVLLQNPSRSESKVLNKKNPNPKGKMKKAYKATFTMGNIFAREIKSQKCIKNRKYLFIRYTGNSLSSK